jgi:CDP-glycerol glycerophosphotransferase
VPSPVVEPGSHQPDVTVVIGGNNDMTRFARAVRSVLNQTLNNLEILIVDNGSTDDIAALARQFATDDSRVRTISLLESSYGCGRARNAGTDEARAPYIMFVDGGDELERHACKNLLVAAEAADADVVAGLGVLRSGDAAEPTEEPWFPMLYAERRVINGILECPELIQDMLCTNKLYRRTFLQNNDIRFAEGVSHEDLVFTTKACGSASRIAVVPEQVFFWNVGESSADVTDVRDHLAAHRTSDEWLASHGLSVLRPLKNMSFLRVGLRRYLADLWTHDVAYQEAWLEHVGGYLDGLDDTTVESAGPDVRRTVFCIRQRDLQLTLASAALWLHGWVTTDPVAREGRVYLADRLLDTDEGRVALDITALHLQSTPLSRLPLYSPLESLTVTGAHIALAGSLHNPLGRLPADGPSGLAVVLTPPGDQPPTVVPASVTAVEPGRVRWAADVNTRRLARPDVGGVVDVRLRVTIGDAVNLSPLSLTSPDTLRAARVGTSARLSPVTTDDAELALHDTRTAGAVSWRQSGPLRRLTRLVHGRRTKDLVYRVLFARLPLRRDTVVFEAHLGQQYGDSPKYVHQALERTGLPHRVVWVYAADTATAWPQDSVLVRRDTWRYYYELARAGYWVDNQGFPPIVRKRPGQRYLQTWHGSPLKRMGLDEPRFAASPAARQRLQQQMSRWDDFVVASSTAEEVFKRAFPMRANILRTGYPRNDPLFHADDDAFVQDLKKRLDLPTDRRIVVYAPTFRDYQRVLHADPQLGVDLDTFGAQAGADWFLLVRAHYLEKFSLHRRHLPYAMDVSEHHDVSELLVVADALLTDYSSVMFDYALTGRPMAFHLYDYDLYTAHRGTYFDLRREAPGPVMTTTDEITEWLAGVDATHARYTDAYRAFRQRHCDYERGTASDDVVRAVFGGLC